MADVLAPGAGPEEIESLGLELRDLGAAAPAKDEGLEVGLALAARIVEAQGGRVEGRIVPGKGCVFSVVLPRVQKAR